MTSRSARAWLPVLVLLSGLLVAGILVSTGPQVEPRTSEAPQPFVQVQVMEPERVELSVRTHGTVLPRTESDLVPEVSGTVVWVSPALVSGGFFSEGDALLRIDPADAEVDLEQARAQLARAQAEMERAQNELGRRQGLADRRIASPQELDRAISDEKVAAAQAREARAAVMRAEKNLSRTELRAPYDGRVREESVDRGQFVSRGSPIATLYAIDYAEVRLPIPDVELAYLELPTIYRGQADGGPDLPDEGQATRAPAAGAAEANPAEKHAGAGPEVRLSARFAGGDHTWTGRVVRTEGELDPKTRMVHGIARVNDPYARSGDRPPLAVGLFVDAEISGRTLEAAFVVPRTALYDATQVWVVDDEQRLRARTVEVLRTDGEVAVIGAGLESGELVCVTPLDIAVEGMQVRTDVPLPDSPELRDGVGSSTPEVAPEGTS